MMHLGTLGCLRTLNFETFEFQQEFLVERNTSLTTPNAQNNKERFLCSNLWLEFFSAESPLRFMCYSFIDYLFIYFIFTTQSDLILLGLITLICHSTPLNRMRDQHLPDLHDAGPELNFVWTLKRWNQSQRRKSIREKQTSK